MAMCSTTCSCILFLCFLLSARAQDVFGCGGFIQASIDIDFSDVEVKLYSRSESTPLKVKYTTDCAPNGYFLIPLYEKGSFTIKVESKKGWNFEPAYVDINVDGKTDPCSQGVDINFVFSGVSVVGRVISQGQLVGPAGVSLKLMKNGETIRTIKTADGGKFDFPNVLPGRHVLKGEHTSWRFQSSTLDVDVMADSVEMKGNIIIAGYEISGMLTSDQGTVEGAEFFLTCLTGSLRKDMIVGCRDAKAIPKNVALPLMSDDDEDILCIAKSDSEGKFVFGSVPTGKYYIYARFQTDVTYEVNPEKIELTVGHDDVKLAEKFAVTGFRVEGRIVYSTDGKGIPLAEVRIKGLARGFTDDSGFFAFDGITSGTYDFDVTTPQLRFETRTLRVSPRHVKLPVFHPDAFRVCGHVAIKSPPNTLTLPSSRFVAVKSSTNKKFKGVKANWDEKNDFCFFVPPGDYVVTPILASDDAANGLALAPAELRVTVVDRPIDGLLFSQFQAHIDGKLLCLSHEKCDGITIGIEALHGSKYSKETESDLKGTFRFENVLPGRYEITVAKETWCWSNGALQIDVKDKDEEVEFVHEGYALACLSSHATGLTYERGNETGKLSIEKGVNKACLSEPGTYVLKPVSCHRFEKNEYEFDTTKPRVIQLTANSHRVVGTVISSEPLETMKVRVVEKIERGADSDRTIGVSKPKKVKGEEIFYTHLYEFWASVGTIEIRPVMDDFLFKPAFQSVVILDEGCPDRVAPFQSERGLYVEGRVRPPIRDVEIEIVTNGGEVFHVATDSQGQYRHGPFEAKTEYSVSATKEGYVLTKIDEGNDFKATKLGYLTIQLSDSDDQPLAGVLLSLTGRQYRNNTLTGPSGSITYRKLAPGTYFVRPLLKEYEFTPASRSIEVEEETEEAIRIEGRQVAFSCYGRARSLSGMPEEGVTIVAEGLASCGNQREETNTNEEGEFRLRGLQPRCNFSIGLANGSLARSLPSRQVVDVQNADVRDVTMIIIRRTGMLDLSGNVMTDPAYLTSIQINLYQDGRQDSPLHTVSLKSSSFFYFPSLPADGRAYIVELDTHLSHKQYTYVLPSSQRFVAKGDIKHVTFAFRAERRTVDAELTTQGSVVAVAVIIGIATIIAVVFQTRFIPGLSDRFEADYKMKSFRKR